jgi:hypothetical protein
VGNEVERADAKQLASGEREFNEVLAPLERLSRRRLTGFGRSLCSRAFDENPDGFRTCVDRALEKGNSSPVGLLVQMVRDRDYDVPAAPPPPPAVNPKTGCTCSSCVGLDRCLYE